MTFAPLFSLPATSIDRWHRGASPIAAGSVAAVISALVATGYASAGQRFRPVGSNLRLPRLVCSAVNAGRNLTNFIRLTRSAGRIWGNR